MKHVFYSFIAIVVALIGFTACQSTKDQVVGSWRYSKSMTTTDGAEVVYDGVDTNNADGTFTSTANISCSQETEIDGTKVRMKVMINYKSSGEWKVNGEKEIVSSPSTADVKVTSVKYFDPSDDSFLGELTGSDLDEYSKAFAKEIQSNLLEASTERIIMLQDNKYVTESTDDDGKKETITYNRLN